MKTVKYSAAAAFVWILLLFVNADLDARQDALDAAQTQGGAQ